MIPIVRLPTVDLCRVVVDTAHIFSDDYVLESIREAQKAMGQDPSVGSALAAFSASIAPVLLGAKYKSSTISILHAMGGSADGGPGTVSDLFHLMMIDEDYAELASAIRRNGAESVLAILYKYGTPPVMDMLSAALHEQAEYKGWQVYMADTCVALVRTLIGKNGSKIPFYSDTVQKNSHAHDSRSGAEIVADIITKRKKRKEKTS